MQQYPCIARSDELSKSFDEFEQLLEVAPHLLSKFRELKNNVESRLYDLDRCIYDLRDDLEDYRLKELIEEAE